MLSQPPMWRIIKTVDQNPGAGASPSTVVDLQTKAVGIACRLGNLSSFITATKELLTCKLLSPTIFKRNSKKVGQSTECDRQSLTDKQIIALIEVNVQSHKTSPFFFSNGVCDLFVTTKVARRTLISAGIQVYAFSYCSEPLVPCKRAYIDLLNMLQENRHNVDAALKGNIQTLFFLGIHLTQTRVARMQSLLVPLSPSFTIHKSGIPSSVLPPNSRVSQRKAPATACGAFPYTPSTVATTQLSLMPRK